MNGGGVKITQYLILAIFSIIVSGCSENTETGESKSVSGEARSGERFGGRHGKIKLDAHIYLKSISSTGGSGWSSMLTDSHEYFIEINIKNIGDTEFSIDDMQGHFIAPGGGQLKLPVRPVQEPYFTFKPGESDTFGYGTNGYTTDLLVSANEKPLLFIFTPMNNNKALWGPFFVSLTDLDNVTRYYEKTTKGKLGKKLVFSLDRPAWTY